MSSDFSEKLLKLLIDIPALQEHDNRNCLLQGVPSRPAGAINRSNAPMTDISNIISAAEKLGKITDSGEWALVVVAQNALLFVKGTSLESEITALISYIKSEQYLNNNLPVVIAAMSYSEAINLIEDGNHNEVFNEFKSYFGKEEILEWINCYREKREDWRPRPYNNKSISNIIRKVVKEYNNHCNEDSRPVQVEFIYEFFDEKNRQTQEYILQDLSDAGGIVIIDEFSLFHQHIRKTLSNAGIGGDKNIAFISITPMIGKHAINVKNCIKEQIISSLERAYNRFVYNFEDPCEFGVNRLETIERLIFHHLKKVLSERDERDKTHPKNMRRVRKELSEKIDVNMENFFPFNSQVKI